MGDFMRKMRGFLANASLLAFASSGEPDFSRGITTIKKGKKVERYA
jgi:hypothetical protein